MRKSIFVAAMLMAAPVLAARTVLPVTVSTHSGVVLALVSADTVNGNEFLPNDGRTALVVQNPGASAITLTIFTNLTEDGDLVVPNRVVSVPAGKIGIIGPFPPGIFTQPDGGVWFSLSAAASVLPLQVIPAQ